MRFAIASSRVMFSESVLSHGIMGSNYVQGLAGKRARSRYLMGISDLSAKGNSAEAPSPGNSEFIDTAVEMSKILRAARIEAPLRPRVVGAIVLALHTEDISSTTENALAAINTLVKTAIEGMHDVSNEAKARLHEVFYLSEAEFSRLSTYIGCIIDLLKRLNIRAAIDTDADFLGMFYEAFLRYGYDNNALGIVFTPRHITRMCVHLTRVEKGDRVIDIACGTGGFLVSAFDALLRDNAASNEYLENSKAAFYGFDTNPTAWSLAMLNMFFRGGKSQILNTDCFAETPFSSIRGKFTRAYLNPPFSQPDEPESRFIDRAMETLEAGGLLATVVKASIFADDEHKHWRQQFLEQHSLLAIISLPEDIFYPTSVPASIVIAQAHIPLKEQHEVFMGRVWYDGYEKLKGRRIEKGINQIPEMLEAYQNFCHKKIINSPLVTQVKGKQLKNGLEWSPQEWLAQPEVVAEKAELAHLQDATMRSIFQASSATPELSLAVLSNFGANWSTFQSLPLRQKQNLSYFFDIFNGRSAGEKNYSEGAYPYISSGDGNNSIIRMVNAEAQEIFSTGGLTVTAFGLARIQPWAFVARGNGGSSVRVLLPRYRMSFRELLWFAAQINSQRWRFFYARMAIKSRLARLKLWSPLSPMPDYGPTIAERINLFQNSLDRLSRL
jgi:type I restriction enzyme M protein